MWTKSMRGKHWLLVSCTLMLTYIGYILWAKYAKLIGPPPLRLSETGEFWLFFSSILAFTIQVFIEDAKLNATKLGSPFKRGSHP